MSTGQAFKSQDTTVSTFEIPTKGMPLSKGIALVLVLGSYEYANLKICRGTRVSNVSVGQAFGTK